jgi:uncharacterized protein YbaA (DUF1428 family)
MNQPTPSATAEDVRRIVARDFDEVSAPAALAMLMEYGAGSRQREVWRVQLAVLKSAGGRLAQLQSALEQARQDYRDVLTWAEYPSYSRLSFAQVDALAPDEKQAIFDADWRQYQDWLTR